MRDDSLSQTPETSQEIPYQTEVVAPIFSAIDTKTAASLVVAKH